MTPALKNEIERFFVTYVTGRTLLPNIRIGRQPYGVLPAGDLRAWREEDTDGARTQMDAIIDGLRWFRRNFEAIADNPKTRVAQMGGGGDEAMANSMRVIGQLASSVSFASRKAVTDEAAWNTLNFTGTIPFVARNWWRERVKARNIAFGRLPLTTENLPLAKLVFFRRRRSARRSSSRSGSRAAPFGNRTHLPL